jgi:Ni,Fe-hydrogenase III small subunit
MNNWFLRGLAAGIRTEKVPTGDVSPGLSAGLPRATPQSSDSDAASLAALCPTRAIVAENQVALVVEDRCVQCMRCRQDVAPSIRWRGDARWARATEGGSSLSGRFARSLHVRVVDAGDCGSCLNEITQLSGPTYNLHRFGIFITPTPRQADVLLVVGPVTRQMREPLLAAYEAMPDPKRVVAVGACAASGGVFGSSIMCGAGAADAVPVDIVVPGCPPPPLAILDALLLVCGQEKRAT